MMTEEDARTKICQESFGVSEIRDGNDNGIRESGPWRCIATQCMAWRWATEERREFVSGHMSPQVVETRPSTTHGYCGLAGKP